jgi:hypothetical protein
MALQHASHGRSQYNSDIFYYFTVQLNKFVAPMPLTTNVVVFVVVVLCRRCGKAPDKTMPPTRLPKRRLWISIS